MTEQFNIQTLIGEATEYVKKQALEVKKPKSWLKSVIAFANGMGGKLIFGVADDVSVQGGVQGVQGGVQGRTIELNDKQKEVLNFCSVPQSASDILDHLNLSQHSKNRKTYVTMLVDAGLLAMTIPDKPNDMRQKYIRTI